MPSHHLKHFSTSFSGIDLSLNSLLTSRLSTLNNGAMIPPPKHVSIHLPSKTKSPLLYFFIPFPFFLSFFLFLFFSPFSRPIVPCAHSWRCVLLLLFPNDAGPVACQSRGISCRPYCHWKSDRPHMLRTDKTFDLGQWIALLGGRLFGVLFFFVVGWLWFLMKRWSVFIYINETIYWSNHQHCKDLLI